MWWFVVPARAAIPVLTEGTPPADAVQAVSARAAVPADQLAAVTLDELVVREPVAVAGDGVFRRCPTTPVDASRVDADLARAAAAVDRGDADAWTQLDRLVVELGCLTQVASPPVGARAFALRAAVRRARGDAPADLALEDAVAASFSAPTGEVPVRFVGGGTSGPWVDGRAAAAPARFSPGLHLLQYTGAKGVRSGWLTVQGEVTVVFADAITRPALDGLSDPVRQEAALAVVASLVEPPVAYVVSGGGIWHVELTPTPVVTELTPPASATRQKSPARR
jgi:hypothetical protein